MYTALEQAYGRYYQRRRDPEMIYLVIATAAIIAIAMIAIIVSGLREVFNV